MVQEIEQWLRRHQVFTEPAYLGETAILLGQQFILSPYLVIYRIEAKEMIICEFRRLRPATSTTAIVSLTGTFTRDICASPAVNMFKDVDITDVLDEKKAMLRRKLLRILTVMGATFTQLDGDNWTVLSAEHLIQRRF